MIVIASAITLLVAGGVLADYWSARPQDTARTFVGRSNCIKCHREQAAAFAGSHHDLAMDIATEQTVLADFNNASLAHDGIESRMFRDGERFMVHTEGPDGELHDFEIKYVFGVEPLQQYMVEFDRSDELSESEVARLQVLRLSWDTEAKRWFYLRPPDVDDKLAPDDPLHWTGIAQRWQTMCADCHSTDLKRNFDPATGNYHTTFSEIDVSCEACHGPGSLHVELANSRSLFWDRNHGYGLAKLKGDDAEPQLQTCAPCHSRRGLLDEGFLAGDPYDDHFSLGLLHEATYFADGQIKDEDYVYGSFIQSRMYHKGIRCTDCHDPHSLKLKHPGNETCTSCHQHAAGKYDVPSHHHHAVGTAGAMCVNCHMPHRTYMDVDPRRDHSLRVPRPDLSVEFGTPNACSSCHVRDQLDAIDESTRSKLTEYGDWLEVAEQGDSQVAEAIEQTDRWCDQACEQWYGDQRQRPFQFGEALAGYRRGDPGAVDQMLELSLDVDERSPAIARATAISELAMAGESRSVSAAREMLKRDDESPLVRAAAVNAFRLAPNQAGRNLVALLKDPYRLVRAEAARVLVESGGYTELSPSELTQLDLALQELRTGLMASSDRGSSHMNWGILAEHRGWIDEAVKAYETAIRVEPAMTGPRTNLASLLERVANERPGPQSAERLAQATRLRAEELPLLARDASLAPENADVQYRYGLSLYLSGDRQQALERLLRAVELAPEVEQFQTAARLLREQIDQGIETK